MTPTRSDAGAPLRALVYVRISQDRTGAHLGVDRQREDCQALAERNGWEIVDTYVDNDLSAYSGKPRKGYRQLLADLDAGRATVVIAWHTDRLHRSPTELEEYIDISDRRGVSTHTCQAGIIDLSTPSGRMTARILGAVARHESEHKAERVARARLQAAKAGKWSGGLRPFGWGMPTGETRTVKDAETGAETEAPVLDMDQAVPDEARCVLDSVDALLGGASLRSRVKHLNDKGVLTTAGNAWTHQSWRDVLLRPRNAGIAVYRGEEIGAGNWQAIVPEEKWRAVVALLTDPGRRTTPGGQVRWLGSLLYRCGVPGCGCPGPMVCSMSGGASRPSYRCRLGHVSRRADKLDEHVTDVILERMSRPDAAELLLPAAENVDVAALQAEAGQIQQRLGDLSGLFGAGQIDAAQLASGSEVAKRQLDGVRRQLADAAVRDPLAVVVGTPDPRAAWKGLGLEEQREILAALVTVTVRKGRPGRMPGGAYTDLDSVDFDWKRGRR
ncbi:recombinase family protein [Streptomyces sp. Z26]|uniref:recombinase family protein n=1 Tax=Streptomyces sp. Z26 TaxID=2500177 RepID=UPI000EF1689F|nr:recombinase family protein [Streptomyces sp. Z26]RLL70522.1 recombinase family protein [Streptomyces sp. Z26]